MRILIIALLVFFLQVSVSFVDVMGIYDFNVATQDDWQTEVEDIKNQQYLRSDVARDASTVFGFGDFVVGLKIFINFIWRTLNIASTLRLFGLDSNVARLFAIPVFALYGMGLAQFIANRGTKGMQ